MTTIPNSKSAITAKNVDAAASFLSTADAGTNKAKVKGAIAFLQRALEKIGDEGRSGPLGRRLPLLHRALSEGEKALTAGALDTLEARTRGTREVARVESGTVAGARAQTGDLATHVRTAIKLLKAVNEYLHHTFSDAGGYAKPIEGRIAKLQNLPAGVSAAKLQQVDKLLLGAKREELWALGDRLAHLGGAALPSTSGRQTIVTGQVENMKRDPALLGKIKAIIGDDVAKRGSWLMGYVKDAAADLSASDGGSHYNAILNTEFMRALYGSSVAELKTALAAAKAEAKVPLEGPRPSWTQYS